MHHLEKIGDFTTHTPMQIKTKTIISLISSLVELNMFTNFKIFITHLFTKSCLGMTANSLYPQQTFAYTI